MLVPNWILGGILAVTLGWSSGLAVRAEPSVPPGAAVFPANPLQGVDVPVRDAFVVDISLAPSLGTTRPVQRPEGSDWMAAVPPLRPQSREDLIPVARWDGQGGTPQWSRATISAINSQRHDLSDLVPADIQHWCPAYASNPEQLRDAFWVGVISALVRHESRYDPRAIGGGGLYHGLLQILPATARHYECSATSGQALLNPEENLACGVRIMSRTILRDGVIAQYDGRWRGIAADWGPMSNSDKRAEMAEWTRSQRYCTLSTDVRIAARPPARPWDPIVEDDPARLPDAIELAMLSTDVRNLRAIP